MNYYPHHIGDYNRDTADLSPLEHGVYRLLMDHYYSTEQPLTTDNGALARVIRATSKQERKALDVVLARFFQPTAAGHEHKRIESELVEYRKHVERNQINGRKGGRPRKGGQKPGGLFVGSEIKTQGEPSQEPRTKRQESVTAQRTRPTLEQALTVASQIAITASEAETWWHSRERAEWTFSSNGATRAVGPNWQSDLKAFVNNLRERKATHANRNSHPQRNDSANSPGRYAATASAS